MTDTDMQNIIRHRVDEAVELLTWGGRRPVSAASEDEVRRTIHACAQMVVEDIDGTTHDGRPVHA